MKDILSEIIANKRFEVDLQSRLFLSNNYRKVSAISDSPLYEAGISLFRIRYYRRIQATLSFKGWIQEEACPEEIVPSYAAAGPPPFPSLLMRSFSEEAWKISAPHALWWKFPFLERTSSLTNTSFTKLKLSVRCRTSYRSRTGTGKVQWTGRESSWIRYGGPTRDS